MTDHWPPYSSMLIITTWPWYTITYWPFFLKDYRASWILQINRLKGFCYICQDLFHAHTTQTMVTFQSKNAGRRIYNLLAATLESRSACHASSVHAYSIFVVKYFDSRQGACGMQILNFHFIIFFWKNNDVIFGPGPLGLYNLLNYMHGKEFTNYKYISLHKRMKFKHFYPFPFPLLLYSGAMLRRKYGCLWIYGN